MNCKEAERLILDRGNEAVRAGFHAFLADSFRESGARDRCSELADHLADCAGCRRVAELCGVFEQVGMKRRDFDLSAESVRETRRRVEEVLKRRADEPEIIEVRVLSWRPVFAAAAVLFILFAGIRLSFVREFHGGDESLAAATGDSSGEINEKRNHISSEIRNFRRQYLSEGNVRGFDERAGELRKRIEFQSLALREELKKIEEGKEDGKQDKKDKSIRGVEIRKGEMKDEYKA